VNLNSILLPRKWMGGVGISGLQSEEDVKSHSREELDYQVD
jgi:uncharacterized protein GlcG (DUF336 family)